MILVNSSSTTSFLKSINNKHFISISTQKYNSRLHFTCTQMRLVIVSSFPVFQFSSFRVIDSRYKIHMIFLKYIQVHRYYLNQILTSF